MVEHGLDANHSMISELTKTHHSEFVEWWEEIHRLRGKRESLQAQLYDVQNQNYEYETRFKMMGLASSYRSLETSSSFVDGGAMPWKLEDPAEESPPSSPSKD